MCIIVNVNGGGLGTRLFSLYPTLWCLSLLSQNEGEEGKTEYRVWNPFRSKLAAAILGGMDKIHIKPGSKVLYLGAASGTTVSHVADIVGPVSALVCENVAMKLQPSRLLSPCLIPRHQIFCTCPAALSKNRIWTRSLVKLGCNHTSISACCRTNQIAQVK